MEKFNYLEKAKRLNEITHEIRESNKERLADLYLSIYTEKIGKITLPPSYCYQTPMGVVHREGCTCREVILSKMLPPSMPELHI